MTGPTSTAPESSETPAPRRTPIHPLAGQFVASADAAAAALVVSSLGGLADGHQDYATPAALRTAGGSDGRT